MSFDPDPVRLLCVGRSKMGKTVFARRYIAGESEYATRFVLDHDGRFAPQMGAQKFVVRTKDQIKRAAAEQWPWIVFDPQVMFRGKLYQASEFWCETSFEIASRMKGRRKVLHIDELQKVIGPNKAPWALLLCVETGRHEHLDLVFCTLSLNAIHNRVLGQLTDLVCYQTTEPIPLEQLQKRGLPIDQIRSFERGVFLHYAFDSCEVYGPDKLIL